MNVVLRAHSGMFAESFYILAYERDGMNPEPVAAAVAVKVFTKKSYG